MYTFNIILYSIECNKIYLIYVRVCRYSKNAKIASEQFKDRPMSPEQSIVYWTEYIHRHKGAPHLKSHALNLAWYQYFLLDVIATILICISIIIFISHYIIKKIFKYSMKRLRNCKVKSE